MDADDAVVLADELPAKGALSLLNLSHNRLGDKGLVAFCDKIAAHQR